MADGTQRLALWFFVEIMQDYPRTVHFFKVDGIMNLQAEIFQSGPSGDDMIYEHTIRADDEYDLMFKLFKYFESFSNPYEIEIRYDKSHFDN